MKKVFIAIVAFMALSSSVMAAGHVDSVRYLTTKFGQNWFISADATANWWQGSMRVPEGYNNSYTAVEWGKPTFGFTANVGKWINHKTAVRLRYSNTRINSYIHRAPQGENDDLGFMYEENATPVEGNVYATTMRYHNLMADFMVSPIDFFQGYYNENRVWTPVLYVGAGTGYTSGDFFALKSIINNLSKNKPEVAGNFELAAGAGLLNNFRLGEHLDLNLDINWTFHRWTIDSWAAEKFENGPRPKRFDNLYSAALGLTYYFSREYDLPNNCCDEMDIMRRKLDSLMNLPAPDPIHDTVVNFVNVQTEDIISYPFSIFFNRDSYELMSRRDLINLREIAEVAKKNNFKIRLRGSADSATATPAYNQTLSENRCNKIKSELMSMGIPESQIILLPVGGVKELDPTEFDRRVLVELMQEAPKQ
ncbi:MAG: OmpA family protein [Bacteroidales bacterium]|nr:OmpA family protein [Bacteroidales bacterium]MDO5315137.1 OmpA family protein [bacterium]